MFKFLSRQPFAFMGALGILSFASGTLHLQENIQDWIQVFRTSGGVIWDFLLGWLWRYLGIGFPIILKDYLTMGLIVFGMFCRSDLFALRNFAKDNKTIKNQAALSLNLGINFHRYTLRKGLLISALKIGVDRVNNRAPKFFPSGYLMGLVPVFIYCLVCWPLFILRSTIGYYEAKRYDSQQDVSLINHTGINDTIQHNLDLVIEKTFIFFETFIWIAAILAVNYALLLNH